MVHRCAQNDTAITVGFVLHTPRGCMNRADRFFQYHDIPAVCAPLAVLFAEVRLEATVKLKENTASDIFRRLNSYSRQHALYQTLKAFGQIIKSLFTLRYIDDLALRQAIEKQLNKVELANRFTRTVAVGNPRGFTQTEKEVQEIAEACNRPIKNSIICWNYLYLARQLEKAPDVETRESLLQLIASHSPMSWAHIHMLGEYDFSEEKLRDTPEFYPRKRQHSSGVKTGS